MRRAEKPIDLRSDTVTRPTEAMREAMARAEVGDDVYGEDPTVNRLQKRTAELLGKEAALFVASGTMSNQLALRSHTEPGDEVILDAGAHIYYFECGGPAALAGISCRLIEGRRGIFSGADLERVLRRDNIHFPPTRLVCIENTHNLGGGAVWSLAQTAEVCGTARQAGLKTHLDGARLWNASVATGVPERQYAACFDSVSVCFSKGLGAPVGSCLAGSATFIARARRFRKMLGGGMRQAGIIAAGALYALEHHRQRLREDHDNARALATGIAAIPGLEADPAAVRTNIVMFRVRCEPAPRFTARLAAAGVMVIGRDQETIRAVTSLEISAADVTRALQCLRQAAAAAQC
jgi:threonine aldolase